MFKEYKDEAGQVQLDTEEIIQKLADKFAHKI